MKLSDLKEGDRIMLDDGFTCHGMGIAEVYIDEYHGPYFLCDDGVHFLDGNVGEDGELIGVQKYMVAA